MKYLFYIIFSLVAASALFVHGKDDTLYLIQPSKVELDSSNNTFNITKYEYKINLPVPESFNYTLPYFEPTKNQAIDDSSKWFPTMLDSFDMLDSLSHEKRSEMFIWLFYYKNHYDRFEINDFRFDTAVDYYKDRMYGGFILNGKAFILVIEDSLKHRREIENMFVKRSDSIKINIIHEYIPSDGYWGIDKTSTVTGIYQDSLLVPYRYIQDSKQKYYLHDSVSKYYGAQK